jgi:hypothetical protein
MPQDYHNPHHDLTTYAKKRKLPDRRRQRTAWWSPYTFRGRRRAVRRGEEAVGAYYLDRYGFRDWFPLVVVLVLCCLDLVANATLHAFGGTDPNPLTSWASSRSGALLVLVQFAPLAAACFYLLLQARVAWARSLTTVLLLVFAALAALHGYLAWDAVAAAQPPATALAR